MLSSFWHSTQRTHGKRRKPRDRSVNRIVYAEEKKDARVIIQEVFADMKQATIVNTVRDGEEALAYLQRKGKYKVARVPDVVLQDIKMPKRTAMK